MLYKAMNYTAVGQTKAQMSTLDNYKVRWVSGKL